MKPKNSVFCNAIRRSKMLFESQKKADNFLKFNANEILEETGKAPVRSYYCSLCMGWHVTSNPSAEEGEKIDKMIERRINTVVAQRNDNSIALIDEYIKQTYELMSTNRMLLAGDSLDLALLELAERREQGNITDKLLKIEKRTMQCNGLYKMTCKAIDFFKSNIDSVQKANDSSALDRITSDIDAKLSTIKGFTGAGNLRESYRKELLFVRDQRCKELITVSCEKAYTPIVKNTLTSVISNLELIANEYTAGHIKQCRLLLRKSEALLLLVKENDNTTYFLWECINKWKVIL